MGQPQGQQWQSTVASGWPEAQKIEVADGMWIPAGMVVLEFESLAKAKAWYNSPDYQAVVGDRIKASDSGLIFVVGD